MSTNNLKEFRNYKSKEFHFDSFNGTETKCFLKIPTKYDEYGNIAHFELVEFANVSSVSAVKQTSSTPIIAIGDYKGIALGSFVVTGEITFEVFNQGFINDIKEVLAKNGANDINIKIDVDTQGNETIKYQMEEITQLNDFPAVDLILIAVKENDPNKKIQKQLLGVSFSQGQSGIGITQLAVRESYSFLAKDFDEFKPVIGAEEDDEIPENVKAVSSIFGGGGF